MPDADEAQQYEQQVWRIGPSDWRWKVRREGAVLFSFAHGRGSSRVDCKRQVLAAIEREEAEDGARWAPVKRGDAG